MSVPILRVENLEHHYNGRAVLRIGHLEVPPGTVLGLAGPNGSGKSTLLYVLAYLLRPTRGRVLFHGREVPAGDEPRGRITLLLQDAYLLKRSVFENVAYGLRVQKIPDVSDRVGQALDTVGLSPEEYGRRQWFELSGGERQRVALASRLALAPEVLLLDEPTSSLDVESAEQVRSAALAARDRLGTTLVVASHDPAWLDSVADEVVRLDKGCLAHKEKTP